MIIRNSNVQVIKKNGNCENFTPEKIRIAITKSAIRANSGLSDENKDQVINLVIDELDDRSVKEVSVEKLHTIVEGALEVVSPMTAKSYKDYRNFKAEFGKIMEDVYNDVEKVMYRGDKENANKDSSLVSTKKSLAASSLYKEIYKNTFLTNEERRLITEGDFYVHDMSDRLESINCCLFRMGTVLKGGFEMANVWYNEPKTLDTAFDVISDVVLSASSQQYGGFTIPQVDKILAYYAEKSYKIYYDELIELGIDAEIADKKAEEKVANDYKQGFQGWEYKFNTVSSSRGDYPFITVTSGLDTSRWGHLGNKIMYKVHQEGQGKTGHKKPVLFPKYVFLYDKELHAEGKELYDVYEAGLECSSKTMYPDWLSLTGEGYVPSMYKKYKAVVSPMGCVDGKEVVTYKANGELFVENFEKFWSKFEDKAVPQRTKDDANLFVDLSKENVLIYDTNKGFVKVTKLIRNVSDKWNKVKLSNGRVLLCTTDHPFETQNRGMVYAENLTTNDTILINSKQYSEETKQVDDLYAWGIGVILCDGCYANSKVSVSIANKGEEEIKNSFKEFANTYYSMDLTIVNQNRGEKGTYQDLNFKGTDKSKKLIDVDKELCQLFGGYKKIERSVPSCVFSWNWSAKMSFLAGMIDADGYINKKSHGGSVVCLGSTNKTLALGQMLLVQALGMPAKIYEFSYRSDDKTKKRYKIEFFCKEELLSFIKCKKKVANYKEESHYNNTNLAPRESKVLEVVPVEKQGYSYDVSTESEHFEVSGIYSHNCRAFLSPYYEKGGQEGPIDENDKPVFEGRFNSGAISLNLPLIYLRSVAENRDFFELLDERLEQIRSLHKRTRDYIGNLYASTNPLAFTQGGFYGGNLRPDQKLKESKDLMGSTTYSFGITALDELQKAYNGRTLINDGSFALSAIEHINKRANEFKTEDNMLYAIYGTPAESLCFDGDTIVQTYGGNKKIKDLTTSDLVYSFNETLKKIELKPVVRSLKTKTNAKVVKVIFDNGQEIVCTPNHPFGVRVLERNSKGQIVQEKIEYVEAQNLTAGMRLKSNYIYENDLGRMECSTLLLDANHKVMGVEELSETRDVYDITVEDNHNFFVGGDDGILVHNCGKQIKQLRNYVGKNVPALTTAGYEIVKKGEDYVIPGICDREYVSNSFHCNVREDISPIQKQDLENRFWDYCNGGKIQYVRYPVGYNFKAMDTLVKRAMEKGFYEGCNLALSYCDDCGRQEIDLGDSCPHCGSKHLTKIDRMNGYLAFSRVKGDTRLNEAKMAEIDDRKSM